MTRARGAQRGHPVPLSADDPRNRIRSQQQGTADTVAGALVYDRKSRLTVRAARRSAALAPVVLQDAPLDSDAVDLVGSYNRLLSEFRRLQAAHVDLRRQLIEAELMEQ